jgi:polysaccharide pyruvyl transferase WcaK-like protein
VGRLLKMPYRLIDFTRAVRICKSIDVLLVPGTGILDDYGGEPPKGWPLALATWFGAAKLRRTRTGLICIGAGPLAHPVSRRLARLTASLADYRSYRDPGSRDFMTQLGVDTSRDAVVPDIVFSRDAGESEPASEVDRPLIVVPVMQYGGWNRTGDTGTIEQRHVAVLAEFACWLLQSGYRVRLVSADWHDVGTTEQVSATVKTADPSHVHRLTTAAVSEMSQLLDNLSEATVVVATRYHSVIGALLNGKPVLSLAYAAKNDHVMETAGLGPYCQHLDSIDLELLKKQLSELAADHRELSRRIATNVARMRNRIAAEEQRLRLQCGL